MTVKIIGNQVRLGIDAPDEVSVHREEIYEKLKGEKNNPHKKLISNKQKGI